MVLKDPPERPRWEFKTRSSQPTLTQFPGIAVRGTIVQHSQTQQPSDNEIEWQAPKDIILCRKGFLIRTQAAENREIVRRLLRDLTLEYPETNFERNRRKQQQNQFWGSKVAAKSSKPPLHMFCSYTGPVLEDPNRMAELADWQMSLQDGESRAQKLERARTSTYLLVPKFFMLEQLRSRSNVEFQDANLCGKPMRENVWFSTNRQLVETERRPQKSATTFALQNLEKTGGAVLVLPVGCGKTVCALYCAMQKRVCTLVVAGTVDLMTQWRERISEFCPNARVGLIQGDVCETENCDFVIACTKSLTERLYPLEAFRNIGMTIYDEAHHAAATTVTTGLWQAASPLMLALSADPTRTDGMTNVLYKFFSYNVKIVLPSLPPGIQLHVIVHKYGRRCFIQDADCVSANRLRERRHNAEKDEAKLEYCEALCSFDKRHYAKAAISAANLLNAATSNTDTQDVGVPGLGALHALSSWQNEFSQTDVEHLNYTQVYQQLQCDAHRNATLVAYAKHLLVTNNVADIRAPTIQECNSVEPVTDSHVFVNVDINGVTKSILDCSRDSLQGMKQVERQILILSSEKQHIDALFDRFVRSGVPETMISVFVGGSNYSEQERKELLARRIIIATYSIAAEGLDIATLNTIMFASPRSAVVAQAVGRALRDKLRPGLMPVIVDFWDVWSKMATGMYYKRRSSAYNHYGALYHFFDDFASYEAVGQVCWKQANSSRTQRVKAEKAAERERKRQERAAEKERLKAEKLRQREIMKAEKKAEKERTKAEKAAEKERIKAEKVAERERMKAENEKNKAEKIASKKRKLVENNQNTSQKPQKQSKL